MSAGHWWKWIIAIPALILSTAIASAAQWHVLQTTGEVWLGSNAAQQVSLNRTATVPDSGIVITGKTGRVALARGADTMVIGPSSVVALPPDRHRQTTILQRAGEAAFTVDRRNVPHFTVETLYLAALVKGTRFTVQVSSTGADVIVDRGLVGVSALATGKTIDITPGQYAIVSGNGTLSAGGIGTLAKITQGKPRSPVVQPLSSRQIWDLAAGQLNGLAFGSVAASNDSNGVGLAVDLGGGSDGGTSNTNNTAGGISVGVGGISIGIAGGSGNTGGNLIGNVLGILK